MIISRDFIRTLILATFLLSVVVIRSDWRVANCSSSQLLMAVLSSPTLSAKASLWAIEEGMATGAFLPVVGGRMTW